MRRPFYDKPEMKPYRRELRNHGTPAEAALWTLIKNRQLHGRKFRRQHPETPPLREVAAEQPEGVL